MKSDIQILKVNNNNNNNNNKGAVFERSDFFFYFKVKLIVWKFLAKRYNYVLEKPGQLWV